LVGEIVHHYGEKMICELCRRRYREPPGRSELVRSPEHERTVKSRPRAA
jgi:hypothetical protein